MKTIRMTQCCYCKENRPSVEYYNVQEIREETDEETKVIYQVAHGCDTCKSFAEKRRLEKYA